MRALPAAYRSQPIYQKLFGDKNPNVFPSPLRGFSFIFAETIKGHRIHLGFRQEKLVVRASYMSETLEFIPSEVFGVQAPFDLPMPLLIDCFHWLNVYNGQMSIRRKDAWVSRPWRLVDTWHQIGLLSSCATRWKSKRDSIA